jgi:N-acyl-L-homoserine lactone synthetase
MIDAISLETAHLLGNALPEAHRLRHRIFIERQQYGVASWRGMEWDEFDTPAAVYLMWRDEAKRPRAIARLIPTSRPYMIQQLWPELITNRSLPTSESVWEVTRFGIDRDIDAPTRARAFGEMICAFAEFGLVQGIDSYLFVTPPQVIAGALEDAGVPVERLGSAKQLGRLLVVAALAPVSRLALHRLRRRHRVGMPVLRIAGETTAFAA